MTRPTLRERYNAARAHLDELTANLIDEVRDLLDAADMWRAEIAKKPRPTDVEVRLASAVDKLNAKARP